MLRKILLFLLVISCFMVSSVYAVDVTKTFAWDEPADLAIIERWELYMGETADGPYTKVTDIPKINAPPFQAPATVDIVGPPGSVQTRYFVMIACGTVQEEGQPVFKCSDDSNEISELFTIPATEFMVPVNFRVLPE